MKCKHCFCGGLFGFKVASQSHNVESINCSRNTKTGSLALDCHNLIFTLHFSSSVTGTAICYHLSLLGGLFTTMVFQQCNRHCIPIPFWYFEFLWFLFIVSAFKAEGLE